jgi:hypothetical protein
MNNSPKEGFLIAAATLGGYAVAFAHEAGYLAHFGIPWDVISLDLTRVLIAIAALLGVVWLFFIFMNPIAIYLRDSKWPAPVGQGFIRLAFPLVALLVFSYVSHVSRELLITFVAMSLVFASVDFLLPLVVYRKTPGYFAKLAAASSVQDEVSLESPIIRALIQYIGKTGYNLVFACAVVILVAYGIGRGEAGKREWFYCPSDSSGIVLVRVYRDTMIGAKYDPLTNRLSGGLVVGIRGEGPWTELTWSRVGRLSALKPGGR